MTEQRTEDYRDVLEDLASSRGFSGAEELARRVVEVDPDYTEREILEAGVGGFGPALSKVIDATEEERVRISNALAGARRRALDICSVPGCKRPAADGAFGCKEHAREFDAHAEEEAWDLALGILGPWMEATRKRGSDELTRVMESALAEAECEYNRALDEREAAEAAVKPS